VRLSRGLLNKKLWLNLIAQGGERKTEEDRRDDGELKCFQTERREAGTQDRVRDDMDLVPEPNAQLMLRER
jgi:hypothetical protein